MDLEVARKSLSKRSAFSTKKIAFVGVAGLVLVVGIGLRASHYFGETSAESEPAAVVAPSPEAAAPSPAETTESVVKTPPVTPVTQEAGPAPSEPAQQAGDAAEQTEPDADAAEQTEPDADAVGQAGPEVDAIGQAEQAELPGSGMILVARRPVEVLASPSASAPAIFGFPAGRPFRVIGREGGFVQIQDLRSSASGWIDATALAAPPPSAPSVAKPSQSKPGAPAVATPSQSKPSAVRKPATASADPKPKAPKKGAPAVANSEPVAEPETAQARRPPSLFGRGGFFGGIFNPN